MWSVSGRHPHGALTSCAYFISLWRGTHLSLRGVVLGLRGASPAPQADGLWAVTAHVPDRGLSPRVRRPLPLHWDRRAVLRWCVSTCHVGRGCRGHLCPPRHAPTGTPASPSVPTCGRAFSSPGRVTRDGVAGSCCQVDRREWWGNKGVKAQPETSQRTLTSQL